MSPMSPMSPTGMMPNPMGAQPMGMGMQPIPNPGSLIIILRPPALLPSLPRCSDQSGDGRRRRYAAGHALWACGGAGAAPAGAKIPAREHAAEKVRTMTVEHHVYVQKAGPK
jgi:hypothetical protein